VTEKEGQTGDIEWNLKFPSLDFILEVKEVEGYQSIRELNIYRWTITDSRPFKMRRLRLLPKRKK